MPNKGKPFDRICCAFFEGDSSGFLGDDLSQLRQLFPKRWEKLGHCLVVKQWPWPAGPLPVVEDATTTSANDIQSSLRLAKCYLKVLGGRVLLLDTAGVRGELRQPDLEIVGWLPSPSAPTCISTTTDIPSTVVTHTENDIKYKFDVRAIMFSSGNGTERGYFGRLKVANETVIDMFSGIGYFSIPLAVHGRPYHVYCLEKNPVSCRFLRENARLNKVELGSLLTVVEGDNRDDTHSGHLVGQADRVLMGYIPPSAQEFIGRALQFLKKPSGGILHYHYLAPKAPGDQVCATAHRHFSMEHERQRAEQSSSSGQATGSLLWTFHIQQTRTVKSYGPRTLHCVSDVEIRFGGCDSSNTT